MSWQTVIRDHAAALADALVSARGAQRAELARSTVREARLALEAEQGTEAAAVRELLASLEAAGREIAP